MNNFALPVIEVNGEEYIVDTTSILTSNPAQYNIYRVTNGEISYMRCSDAAEKKIVRTTDKREIAKIRQSGAV